jgi:hypothetical protein
VGAVLAHAALPGAAPFVASGLLLGGIGALVGAGWLYRHRARRSEHALAVGLGVVGAGCLILGTILPVVLGARPSLGRPSTTAHLTIVSPSPGKRSAATPGRSTSS